MAHHSEPMDVDCLDSDFDNKENFHHSNVLPCTEKGYEELDVSELNMKLRYSITPTTSPMSKSYTADETRNLDLDESVIGINENCNLTRSLNSTMTKNDSLIKSLKALPLQTISTEVDNNHSSVLRQLDTTIIGDNNVTVTISGPNDDENLSLPSSSSSAIHTPEATTPTNLSRNVEGSTIIRGLKTVFNMFRSSQSPVSSTENENVVTKLVGPLDETYCEDHTPKQSTPIAAHRNRGGSTSKRSSPLKDSLVFNDDLEKELKWKEDTTLSSEEKLPIQKSQMKPIHMVSETLLQEQTPTKDVNSNPVEYMDISYNSSVVLDSTVTEILNTNGDSDGEFVDCETILSKSKPQQDVQEMKSKRECNTLDSLNVTKNIDTQAEKDNTTTEIQEDKAPNGLNIAKENKNNNSTIDTTDSKDMNSTDAVKELDDNVDIIENLFSKNQNQFEASLGFVALNATEEIINKQEADLKSDRIEEKVEVAVKSICEIPIEEWGTNPAETTFSFPVNDIETSTLNKSQQIPPVVEQNVINSQVDAIAPHNNEISLLEQKLKEGSMTVKNLSDISSELSLTELFNFEVNAKKAILNKDISDAQTVDVMIKDKEEIEDVNNKNLNPENKNPDEDLVKSECHDRASNKNETPKTLTDNDQDLVKSASHYSTTKKIDRTPESTQLSEIVEDHDGDSRQIDIIPETSADNNSNEDLVKSASHDRASKKIDKTPESSQLSDIAEDHVMHALTSSDIPSPEDNSCGYHLGCNTPDVLDSVNTLESTNVFENASEEISKKNDLLNETDAIINSLNEIISESQNKTVVLTDNILEHSLNELIDNAVYSDDAHKLPDLVNQNTDSKIVPSLNQLVDDSKTINSLLVKTISDTGAMAENTTFQINESITIDKEQTVSVADASDIVEKYLNNVEIVPNAKACQDGIVMEIKDSSNTPIVNEELVLSEHKSPNVLVKAETESKPTNDNDIPKNVSNEAPSSPPILSKGYNFNFDEIDDPFATKTKISLSHPSTPGILETTENKKDHPKKVIPNRRKSQAPERKRPPFNKRNNTINLCSSIESPNIELNDQNSKGDSKDEIGDIIKSTMDTMDMDITVDNEVAEIFDSTRVKKDKIKMMAEAIDISSEKDIADTQTDDLIVSKITMDNKSSIESMSGAKSDIKLSSSEQSTYYSAATSSNDSIPSKNVFNLPEIDDMNFNPFATKSKMRQSPQHHFDPESPLETTSKTISPPDLSEDLSLNLENMQPFAQKIAEDKMDTELMEKDSAYNITNTTSSSKGTDGTNITIREVNTEDEDTEEGPFLEVEDANLLDIDEDLLQFNEIPTHANEENSDGGELFIDAEAFEFLLNKNQTNVVADSGKESLFLKFDPLFAKRISSDGVLAALKHVQKRQSTPTKRSMPSLKNEASPIAGPSTINTTFEGESNDTQDSVEDLNVTVAKPMMVVTPAVNPTVSSRNKATTPPRSNRRSFTFTSPAMAVIDRLLSLSGNSSFLGHDTTVTQATYSEADVALSHLRELLAEKENSVDQLRTESNELKYRLSTMESQVKILEADGQERLSKINILNERLAEKTKINKSMAAVVEEYERTIASLIAETEQDKKRHAEERLRLINERDEQTSHLASMEVSFSDLHSKYEKSKQIILSCKANEETCKKSIKEFEDNLAKMQANYEMLKQHATSKLNHANQELQKINKAHEADVLKLNAMIKRKDMDITSLEETLAQKTKANEELTAICDELINKVG